MSSKFKIINWSYKHIASYINPQRKKSKALFGKRKIDSNKTNEEVKNSKRSKSKNGQQKRRTTTIENEETKQSEMSQNPQLFGDALSIEEHVLGCMCDSFKSYTKKKNLQKRKLSPPMKLMIKTMIPFTRMRMIVSAFL